MVDSNQTLVELGPGLVDSGPKLAAFDSPLAEFGTRPISGNIIPELVGVAQVEPRWARAWPTSVRNWSISAQGSPTSAKVLPSSAKVWWTTSQPSPRSAALRFGRNVGTTVADVGPSLADVVCASPPKRSRRSLPLYGTPSPTLPQGKCSALRNAQHENLKLAELAAMRP